MRKNKILVQLNIEHSESVCSFALKYKKYTIVLQTCFWSADSNANVCMLFQSDISA